MANVKAIDLCQLKGQYILGHCREVEMDIVEGRTSAEIARNLELAIRQGQIEAGERLPPVREVADRLGVNRNTVTSAYSRLRDAGLITGAGRQGSRVAAILDENPTSPLDIRDLASGNVDPQFLPRLDAYLGRLAHTPGGYEMADDEERLVSFGRSRFVSDGLPATEIAVVSGSIDAIERALRARLAPGSSVAVEDPGYASVLHLLRAMSFPIIPLQMDDDGVRPSALSAAMNEGARAVVLTPRAQNPSGRRMTADRAGELKEILDAHADVLLLEDDHAGEVSGAPPVSAAPSDPERRLWMTIRSVSKFLGPDLRLALAAGDRTTIARVRDQQALGPRWVSHILQRLAYEMWSAPETATLMKSAAHGYEARRRSLIEHLVSAGIEAFGSSGLHVWVPVAREGDIVQAMLSRGWSIQAGDVFRIKSGPAVRIGVANLAESECKLVASDLADSLKRSRRFYT